MTSRRYFIFGTFVLGCALALGIKPKRPEKPFVRSFDIASGPDQTTYLLFENGRLVATGNRVEDILPDSQKNS